MLQEIKKRGIQADGSICVSTDTRKLPAGCIFFALKGENFNGNKFAADALAKGAALAVVDEKEYVADERFILVQDTLRALQELAREWREQWGKTIIGITGTNGKTTTKELTAAVLSTKYSVLYTEGNLNNQVGVPLTLLRLTDKHDLAIIEMGASHPGDIRELVEIAEPDCGLITNVGKAHLLGFGSFEGVMQTKKELYDYLRAKGMKQGAKTFCFRNLDNKYLEQMAGDLPTIGYHTGKLPAGTHLVGEYNSENVQAALCVGGHFGISREDGLKAVRAYIPSNNRSQRLNTEKNTLIVDAYNANPTSMQAAILNFLNEATEPTDGRHSDKAFILGDMLELGEYSHTEHQNIVNMLLEQKQTNVILVGSEFGKTTAPYPVFADAEALSRHLEAEPIVGKTILLKGSHGIHLETLLNKL